MLSNVRTDLSIASYAAKAAGKALTRNPVGEQEASDGIDIAHHSFFNCTGDHDLDWRRGFPVRDVEDARRCPVAGCAEAGSIYYIANHMIQVHTDPTSPTKCITCVPAHDMPFATLNIRRRNHIQTLDFAAGFMRF